ncbi:MAG: ABC transporter permease [bacterium]|nr:ABC transporter permease [bacterium]
MNMSWLAICRTAAKNLMCNGMRTLLSILSVSVGVFCIIAVLALINGLQVFYGTIFNNLGVNFINIISIEVSEKRSVRAAGAGLTLKDCEAIGEGIPGLAAISPVVKNSVQVVFREYNWKTDVVGCSSDYGYIENWKVARGRFISEEDVHSRLNVCVLGDTVAEELFPDMDPMEEIVRIDRTPVLVVGVLAAKGQGSLDDAVFIPYTTAMERLFHRHNLDSIVCAAASEETVAACGEQIARLLRLRHGISEDDKDDFWMSTQERVRRVFENITDSFVKFTLGLASISLLVSGIGIMNVMMVSVTERIREIGIRMALGARRRDILLQFLVESVIMSLAGGLLGLVFSLIFVNLGITDVLLTKAVIEREVTNSLSYISWDSVALAFCFSVAMGIFFGFYPALQASKLDPIQALRHE